jgi:hypothetical protein
MEKMTEEKAHGTGDGLFTPFDLNLLALVSRFLLQSTGTGGRLPRLSSKEVVGVTIESRLGSSFTWRITID